MRKSRPDYSCSACGIDIDRLGEYSWMVHDELWNASLSTARRRRGIGRNKVSQFDVICIGCFEARIHRALTGKDFDWNVPLNTISGFRSERLLARMGHHFLAAHQMMQERDRLGERYRDQLKRRIAGAG